MEGKTCPACSDLRSGWMDGRATDCNIVVPAYHFARSCRIKVQYTLGKDSLQAGTRGEGARGISCAFALYTLTEAPNNSTQLT